MRTYTNPAPPPANIAARLAELSLFDFGDERLALVLVFFAGLLLASFLLESPRERERSLDRQGSDATAAPSKHHRSPGFTGSHPAAEHISAPLSFTSPIHSLSLVQITSPGLHGTNLCAPSSEKKSFRHAPYKASHADAQIGVPSAVPTLPSHTLHSTAAHASRHVSENPFNCMCTTFARTASVCARPQHVFARCASQNVIPFPLPGADPSRANASCARLLLHVSTVPAPRATPPPHSTSTSVTTIVRDIIPPIVPIPTRDRDPTPSRARARVRATAASTPRWVYFPSISPERDARGPSSSAMRVVVWAVGRDAATSRRWNDVPARARARRRLGACVVRRGVDLIAVHRAGERGTRARARAERATRTRAAPREMWNLATTRTPVPRRAGDVRASSGGGGRRRRWSRGMGPRRGTTDAGDGARMDGARAEVALTRAPECALTWSENGAYAVRGTMTVRGVSATSVYNLLTDYEASPRAFRAVRSVRVIECEGDACVATNVYIEQECEWKFFVFGGAFPTAFEVEERDEELKMRCSLAPGRRGTGFLRDFEGAWAVEDGPEGVRIEHTLMVKPKFTPPYASKVFVQQVDQILQDLLVEIESWNGAPYDAPPHRRG